MENALILRAPPSLWTLLRALLAPLLRLLAASGADTPVTAEVGETAAHLLDAYGNSILRLAYSYLHSMEDAEEVVQDTLLQYMQTAPAFIDPTHEKAWCLRVAGNLAKNRIKYNRVRDTDELNEELMDRAFERIRDVPLETTERTRNYMRAAFPGAEWAVRDPKVQRGTTVTSDNVVIATIAG